ncbi:aspartate/glutamate racemase family protein [Naasia sp. SYSU D00057]|uniref:aspartate/glutamate racemase family protein n=1 Tax=Naasia sp. SYSU D00057 TaxID=2817380 RepID=UPI001B3168E8|nr:hypothetical protein [Naasia sp. SYSU D00057]
MRTGPLVALVSAVPAAIPPAVAALEEAMPDARVWNILDDRLIDDANEAGGVTGELDARMRRLIDHAIREGADAVLLTCSLYGFVARDIAAGATIPVLGPDDAAFEAVRTGGYSSIYLVSSVELALADSTTRLREHLGDAADGLEIHPVFAPAALAPSRAGDAAGAASAIADAVEHTVGSADAVIFAQYSLAPAAQLLEQRLGLPVLTGPGKAASLLGERLRS